MRLEYRILCIDDRISSLRDLKRTIRNHNSAVGIHTDFVDIPVEQGTFEETDDFRKRIFRQISTSFNENQIDLVIVDLHLGNMEGHEVVDHIRGTQTIYRPIVFYSGGSPTGEDRAKEQLQDGLINNNLVGKSVFLSVRGRDLERDLKKICSEMHVEEHKLNASRGLLMDQTSEIDALTIEFLKRDDTLTNVPEELRDTLEKDLKKVVKSQRKSAARKVTAMDEIADKDLNEISSWLSSAQPTQLDSMGWNKFLRAFLKRTPGKEDTVDVHLRYFNSPQGSRSISSLRNAYAHQTAREIGTSHDDEQCKFIRTELRTHLLNISRIVTSSK